MCIHIGIYIHVYTYTYLYIYIYVYIRNKDYKALVPRCIPLASALAASLKHRRASRAVPVSTVRAKSKTLTLNPDHEERDLNGTLNSQRNP